MNLEPRRLSSVSQLSPELALELNDIYDLFDADARAARRDGAPMPRPEAYVERVAAPAREALAKQLARLRDELTGATTERAPEIPGYDIVKFLDGGGFGEVWQAREQEGARRDVAIKLIRSAELARLGRQRAIWEVEGEVVARLSHENIVRIDRFGEHHGDHYIVMELAEDGDLRQRMNQLSLATDGIDAAERGRRRVAIARLLEQVARAVHFVHQRGVLHRDLKPANILLRSDQPKVCDFGLARRLEESIAVTWSGQVVGTLPYMAPEQAYPEKGQPPTVKVDTWALGAILYELLTGRPPFMVNGSNEVNLVRKGECDLTTLDFPGADLDLEWICQQCLQKAPSDRFSAEELAVALGRYLERKRVRPVETLPEKVRRLMLTVDRKAGDYQDPHYPARYRGCLRAEAATSFVCHAGMFVLAGLHPAGAWLWLWFLALDTGAGFLIWRRLLFGSHGLSPMEQLVAQFWLGGDLAAVVLFSVFCPLLGKADPESIGVFYAGYAVVRGMIFFIEGRTCWGRLYLVSLVFFAAAYVMGVVPRYAPLLHGVLYSGWFLWHSCGPSPTADRPAVPAAAKRGGGTGEPLPRAEVTPGRPQRA